MSSPDEEKSQIRDVKKRESWGRQSEFFLSCLGYAIGFGNIWRFPYLCYKNGGAAFLIPYVSMVFCVGFPMFFLELALGQLVNLGPGKLFYEIAPVFKGVGWAMIVCSALTTIYYNMIIAWSLFYISASFTSNLPWSHCDNDFNSENCFTYSASSVCRNVSLFYYNRTCITAMDLCAVSDLPSYNDSHCLNIYGNRTNVVPAETTVTRISASEDYFQNGMLGMAGTSWDNLGGIQWEMVGCLLLSWIIIAACLFKGVKTSGKVVYITATVPFIILITLFIKGITLEGAYKGIEFYILKPNVTRLLEIEVWNDAATQIFYSMGIAYGVLSTLSSYNNFHNNCMRDTLILATGNCCTSIFSGFVVFSILGNMASKIGVEVKDVARSGSGLAFIAYPEALAMLPLPPLWSILFFLMLITIGADTQFSMVEAVTTGLFDQFPNLRSHKSSVIVSVCSILFLCGITMCLQGGIYMFELFNWYTASLSLAAVGIFEIFVVQYVYGFKKFMKNIREDMGIWIPKPLYFYWAATWLLITPLTLMIIMCFAIYYYVPARLGDYVFPSNIQTLGWFIMATSVACIPGFGLWVYFSEGKRGQDLFSTTPDFCPAQERVRKAMIASHEDMTELSHDNEVFQIVLYL